MIKSVSSKVLFVFLSLMAIVLVGCSGPTPDPVRYDDVPEEIFDPTQPCAEAGGIIGDQQEMPHQCCAGLEPAGSMMAGSTGDCIPAPPGGLSTCTNCGDGFCNATTGENSCNCEDCRQ